MQKQANNVLAFYEYFVTIGVIRRV